MKKLKIFIEILLIVSLLAACGGGGGGTSATLNDIGSVEGTVTDKNTGSPISGATVSIGNLTATTGSNGVYTLTNLAVGSRTITAIKSPGYQEYSGNVTVLKGTTVKCDIVMTSINTTAKTTATIKINLSGTLPSSSAISGVGFTLSLPANVIPALSNNTVANGVVVPSGTFAGSTIAPQIVYTAATAANSGTLKVTLASSTQAGVSQVGEVATITLQLSGGVEPTLSSFGLTAASVIDTASYSPIPGITISVASVTLQ